MLKTEAFELDVSLQLTDKQRRKLEKKAEKQRQKEKPLSSKKQKKLMKESDENVDLRKIDQYVILPILHFCTIAAVCYVLSFVNVRHIPI